MTRSALLAALATVALLTGCAATAEDAPVGPVEIEGVGAVTVSPEIAALVPASVQASGLRVVTSAPYPPYEFYEDDQLVGLDIDLAHAIAAKLGIAVNLESVDFDGVVPALLAGKYDIALAGMEDTQARREVVDFIDYAKIGTVIVVPAANPHGISAFGDLCGLTVAVERGTSFNELVEERQTECINAGANPVTLSEQADQGSALLAIMSGNIDALLTQNTSGSLIASEQPDRFLSIADGDEPDGLSGIAIPRESSELFEAIFAATQELGADGTLAAIFDKWGIADVALIPTQRNAGFN